MENVVVTSSKGPGAPRPKEHFVVVPLMAQGHMIPMVDLAQLLAERGVLVSFITTPFNAGRLKSSIDLLTRSGLPIRFVSLPFPCAEVGLPDGCENIDVLPSADLASKFFEAASLLRRPLEKYLLDEQRQERHPSCIISDSSLPWTWDVARVLRIPRLCFYGICCFTLLCDHNVTHDNAKGDMEPFLVPGLQHRIEVTRAQAPGFFAGSEWDELREAIRAANQASQGVLVNSFEDLEPWYVESYGKAVGQKVWTLGPYSLCNRVAGFMSNRGKDAAIDEKSWSSWLDSKEPGSVVYVCFGSLTFTNPAQLMELGLGLEASEQSFVWVIKEVEMCQEVKGWLAEGFRERMSGRGLIIEGWAPQAMILSHPSIGGFMTHCGWNSSMEAVSMGLPMITWPQFADQFLNERFIVDVLKTGVPIGVKVPASWGEDNQGVFATRHAVEEAVKALMDPGKEGKERRERARELAVKARRATQEGGSSYQNITLLTEQISRRAGRVQNEGKL